MHSQSKWVKPPPPMKNIHGGPAVNPCTQGPEFGATPLGGCMHVSMYYHV